MKIQKTRDQHFLTLPKKVMEAMGWEKGDDLLVKVVDINILSLEKKKVKS